MVMMKKWMQSLAFCLMLLMVSAGTVHPVLAEMLDMTGFNEDVITVSKVPRGKAGNKITIKMTVHNDSEREDGSYETIRLANAYEYERLMEQEFGDDSDEDENGNEIRRYNSSFPFEADSSTFDEKKIHVKAGSSKAVSMTFKLRRDLNAGYYQAFFIIDGGIEVGVNLWVSAYDGEDSDDSSGDSDYEFSAGDGQPTPYGIYGQVLNYGVNLTNMGNRRVYDVRVDMQLDPDVNKFPFDINEGNYIRRLGTMEAGQMVTVPYSMAVREDVKSGFFPITYQIIYREEEGGDFAAPVDKIVYVRIKGEDDDEISSDAGEEERTKARIIVDSFETIPAELFAGQPFELKVRMKNASTGVNASNIMFTFESEEADSSPVLVSESGSTSVVVNQLQPGEITELSMFFRSAPTAEQKSYRMTIKEQYDSPEFKNAKEEVKISLPIRQQARLNTSTMEVMPDNINVGSESNVMFGINNTGKVLLYNVMVRFEGASIQTTDAYVGNIKPGETGNVDAMLTGMTATTDDGKITAVISYEDENGEITEEERELTLFVNESMEDFSDLDGRMDLEEMDTAADAAGSGSSNFIFFAGLAAAAAAGGVIILNRRRKKKAAAEKEEIEDEI